ncbi:MAG: hypothetical protein AUJ92_08155 [Armatimonadetes bacterium CG2_30_59_28]|nr:YgjV family protein [Armatimonadota bacterium]OIO95317.1 MAG: hypothetical protein AUJ92_08155 [Armatimonadetes bacterium CG2_30_59_28]PIU62865.1 MAG: hypothetical protein COS85_17300 [Armatimonadetes bacterium CG07_land_8_20_14_0_80_59_28]PIY43978.1 MAG: hypothetical protein COZ05_09555 [Armatimonadetes bacterium CG_4_10_14_3_um_filter_59_10]PJB71353.1 MAG: hypothetical protein CO095_08130 [Armatimonadetes bacterium CG_4_9_14_3_um_filter_58_7]
MAGRYACHFFILGETAPGTPFLIIGARSAVAAFTVNCKVLSLFIGLILLGFLFSYNGPLVFLGLFAALSATYRSFQKSERRVLVLTDGERKGYPSQQSIILGA